MGGFSILMFIFAACVLLVGFYMYKGHKISALEWRAAYKNLSIDEWKNIGKWTMIVSVFIFIVAIIGVIFKFD